MNKSESKYFNTALLMDEALLLLLEKKDLEYISVKEICEKAGVNRSTFYLHYENINDLLEETIEMLNKDFMSSFEVKEIKSSIKEGKPEDAVFIQKDYLIPYLEFVKRNKRVLRLIHDKPSLFQNEKVYEKMKEDIFIPAIKKFKINQEEIPYRLEFFTRGVLGIVMKWLDCDCLESIENIAKLIIDCVGFSK